MSNSFKVLLIITLFWIWLACLCQNGLGAGVTSPPALLLANELRPEINPVNYLVSENCPYIDGGN